MRLPTPPLTPKHREEQLKLGANLLQAIALALFGAVLLAPLLTTTVAVPLWGRLLALFTCALAELLAFQLLRYIPPAATEKDTQS